MDTTPTIEEIGAEAPRNRKFIRRLYIVSAVAVGATVAATYAWLKKQNEDDCSFAGETDIEINEPVEIES